MGSDLEDKEAERRRAWTEEQEHNQQDAGELKAAQVSSEKMEDNIKEGEDKAQVEKKENAKEENEETEEQKVKVKVKEKEKEKEKEEKEEEEEKKEDEEKEEEEEEEEREEEKLDDSEKRRDDQEREPEPNVKQEDREHQDSNGEANGDKVDGCDEEEDFHRKESPEQDLGSCADAEATSRRGLDINCQRANALWRANILEQVAVRDRHVEAITALYEQYSDCRRGLQASKVAGSFGTANTSCFSPGSAGGCSPVLGPQSPPLGSGESAESMLTSGHRTLASVGFVAEDLLELPRAAVDAAVDLLQGPPPASQPPAVQELAKRLAKDMLRRKAQELDALQLLLLDREDELREKEQAHAVVCRQATLLGQENAELTAQLGRAREQLQARNAEAERLLAEVQRLREAGGNSGTSSGSSGVSSGSRKEGALDTKELFAKPVSQKVWRKIHAAELTCVTAAGLQGDPLPRALVAIGTADGYVKLLDGVTGRLHAHLSVSRELPKLVAMDLAEATGLLLAASSEHALRLLDLRGQRLLHTLRGHLGPVTACGWLKGGCTAFTASADRTVKLWDIEKGQTLRSLSSKSPVTAAGVHLGSGVIALGHADGSLAVWDPRTSDAIAAPAAIHQQGQAVVGVKLSPDGRRLLTQSEDGLVCCTPLETMQPQLRLTAPGPVTGPSPPAFSPDGSLLFARGSSSIHCWSAESGKSVYEHATAEPICVCWDLPNAVSVHRDGHFAIWGT